MSPVSVQRRGRHSRNRRYNEGLVTAARLPPARLPRPARQPTPSAAASITAACPPACRAHPAAHPPAAASPPPAAASPPPPASQLLPPQHHPPPPASSHTYLSKILPTHVKFNIIISNHWLLTRIQFPPLYVVLFTCYITAALTLNLTYTREIQHNHIKSLTRKSDFISPRPGRLQGKRRRLAAARAALAALAALDAICVDVRCC